MIKESDPQPSVIFWSLSKHVIIFSSPRWRGQPLRRLTSINQSRGTRQHTGGSSQSVESKWHELNRMGFIVKPDLIRNYLSCCKICQTILTWVTLLPSKHLEGTSQNCNIYKGFQNFLIEVLLWCSMKKYIWNHTKRSNRFYFKIVLHNYIFRSTMECFSFT